MQRLQQGFTVVLSVILGAAVGGCGVYAVIRLWASLSLWPLPLHANIFDGFFAAGVLVGIGMALGAVGGWACGSRLAQRLIISPGQVIHKAG